MNIQELYPKTHFQKATPEAKLPLYIAYGTEDNLKAAVKVLHEKKTLNKALSTRGPMDLTPLMVAAAKGRDAAVNLLLNNGADPVLVDHKGWTALHHAEASGYPKIGDIIRDKTPTLDQMRNTWGATPLDLRAMLSPSDPKTTQFRYRDSTGEIVSGDVAKFAKLTNGAILTNTLVATPESLYFEWRQPTTYSQSPLIENYVRSKVEGSQPAPLYVAQVEGKGWGLFCERDLEPGEYIGEYVGLIHPKEGIDSKYSLGRIDGEHARNLLPMANDGLPNMDRYPLPNFNGYGVRYPFITHERVPADTELTFNYGYGYWSDKIAHHVPSRVEEAENFFKEHSIEELFSELTSDELFKADSDTYLQRSAMLNYLYSTPSLHFYLMLKGIVDIDQFEDLFNKPLWRGLHSGFQNNANAIKQVESIIKLCRDYIQNWDEAERDAVAQYYLEGLAKHKFLTMVNVLGCIAKSSKDNWLEDAKMHEVTESFKIDLSYGLSYFSAGKKNDEEVYNDLFERAAKIDPTLLAQIILPLTNSLNTIIPDEEKRSQASNLLFKLFLNS